ncbi:MAG: ABC transporter permease [Clostridiales bacterium]|nr:ABC transporter permease [Clostridiales bacterium]
MKKVSSIFLILIYTVTIYFTLYISASLALYIKNDFFINNFKNNKSIEFTFESEGAIANIDLDMFDENIIISKNLDTSLQIVGVFYINDIETKFDVEGRYFNEEDFKLSKKVAIVGEEVLKELRGNENKYYRFHEDDYEVIGVIKGSSKGNWGAYKVILNLNSIPITVAELHKGKYSFSSDDFTYEKFKKTVEDEGVLLSEGKKVNVYSPIESSINNNSLYLVVFALILMVSVMNIIVSLRYWIDSMRKEIGIRKCLGANSFAIPGLLIKRLSKYIILACLASFVIYGVTMLLMGASFSFSLFTLLFVLIVLILTTFAGVLPMIYKVRKIQPVEMMR